MASGGAGGAALEPGRPWGGPRRETLGMELHKDDRVKMPTKPEWGMGQVLRNPAAGKVCILFREAGEKILSLKHAKLVGVEGEEARDPRSGVPMDCLSCHGVHDAPYEKYMHLAGDRELCLSCHTDLARRP